MNIDMILKAVDDELELPGEMPEPLHSTLLKAMDDRDIDLLIELLRITVRATKTGIRSRIQEMSSQGAGGSVPRENAREVLERQVDHVTLETGRTLFEAIRDLRQLSIDSPDLFDCDRECREHIRLHGNIGLKLAKDLAQEALARSRLKKK